MRTPRYQQIADELRSRLESSDYTAGGLLPSEATLSGEFSVSRVTTRRALEELRIEGLIDSRQGLGWFVAAEPLRQVLSWLDTIEEQLAASGVVAGRRVLDFAFIDPPSRAREVLGDGRVLEVRRLNLADGEPFARVTVWCPETIGASLSRDAVEARPFYDLLSEDLSIRLSGAQQTIGAGAASPADAKLLGVPEASPVLICERVTRSADGTPVLLSEHIYPAHLTAFTVEMPSAGRSEAPTGLRLVE